MLPLYFEERKLDVVFDENGEMLRVVQQCTMFTV